MIRHYTNYSLLGYNTFAVDAMAADFFEFETSEDTISILPLLRNRQHFVIGSGSNLLFVNDYNGVILHSRIRTMDVVSEDSSCVYLRVGSGCNWDDLVQYTVENGWSGLENLSLIPGEVGASAVQNIGAYGVEAKDNIHLVEAISVLDGSITTFSNGQCCYAYRQSVFKNELKNKYIITHVIFRLSKSHDFNLSYGNLKRQVEELGTVSLSNIRKTIISVRKSKLPDTSKFGSAGSFFMNPVVDVEISRKLLKSYPSMPHFIIDEKKVKIPAGWLIEQCGWKTKSATNVSVYEHQALVIVNRGGATGRQIMEYAEDINFSVREKFGIALQLEVIVVGS